MAAIHDDPALLMDPADPMEATTPIQSEIDQSEIDQSGIDLTGIDQSATIRSAVDSMLSSSAG
jgi:hypothetical protein